jgi:tRNA (cmo5U34)-methyltransferase
MMTVAELFNRSAQSYDQARPLLVPCFDDIYDVALRLLPRDRSLPLAILDIGAGTGLLSGFVAETYPNARITLIDVAEEMLARAAERMAPYGERITIRALDMRELDFDRPFDAVVSALAIHHLEHPQKRELFGRIYALLRPGGRFVNLEQVLGPTPAIEREYEQAWLDAARRKGASEEVIAGAHERMRQDRCAPVPDQLAWLEQAGFANVHCWYQWYRFAVYSGDKPDS